MRHASFDKHARLMGRVEMNTVSGTEPIPYAQASYGYNQRFAQDAPLCIGVDGMQGGVTECKVEFRHSSDFGAKRLNE